MGRFASRQGRPETALEHSIAFLHQSCFAEARSTDGLAARVAPRLWPCQTDPATSLAVVMKSPPSVLRRPEGSQRLFPMCCLFRAQHPLKSSMDRRAGKERTASKRAWSDSSWLSMEILFSKLWCCLRTVTKHGLALGRQKKLLL